MITKLNPEDGGRTTFETLVSNHLLGVTTQKTTTSIVRRGSLELCIFTLTSGKEIRKHVVCSVVCANRTEKLRLPGRTAKVKFI
jgi:hypothetical protein